MNNATAGSISIANNLGGAGAQLQQLGAGTLTLSGANTYTGVTTIAAGTLALKGTGSIAASTQVNLTNTGATFNISGTTAGASIVSLSGVSGSNVHLGTQTLTMTNGNTLDIYYGTIGGGGGLKVTGGFAVLGGANTYTGVTTINSGGDLSLNGTGSIATSSKVIDNGSLDLSVMSVDSSIKSLAGTNTGAQLFLGSHTLTLTAANDTYAGFISGSGGLTLGVWNGDAGGHLRLQRRDHDQRRHPCRQHLARIVERGHGEYRRHACGHRRRRQHLDRGRHLRAGLGHAGLVDDGFWRARLHGGIDLCRQYQPDHIVVRPCDRYCDAGRRDRECDLCQRQLRRQAIHHPDRAAVVSGTFGSLVNTNLPANFKTEPELRRQPTPI